MTDNEKEQLRGRTRSESRYKPKKREKTFCPEKDFDDLYLKTKSVSSISNFKEKDYKNAKDKVQRQTLVFVNSDYNGSALNRTVSVRKGEVVVLIQGGEETDVDLEWFYIRKRDGSQGFIPAAIAGHGYI